MGGRADLVGVPGVFFLVFGSLWGVKGGGGGVWLKVFD